MKLVRLARMYRGIIARTTLSYATESREHILASCSVKRFNRRGAVASPPLGSKSLLRIWSVTDWKHRAKFITSMRYRIIVKASFESRRTSKGFRRVIVQVLAAQAEQPQQGPLSGYNTATSSSLGPIASTSHSERGSSSTS